MSSLCDVMSYVVLGWVKFELDEILCQVCNEVEYYVEDLIDVSCMCICVGYLYQVQGILCMVELYVLVMVVEELEQLVNVIGVGCVVDCDEVCVILMCGSVLLFDYLECLQNGYCDILIVLMLLFNEICVLCGEEGVIDSVLLVFVLDSVIVIEVELDYVCGSLSGCNCELFDMVGSVVKEELLCIKDVLDLYLCIGGVLEQLQIQVNEFGVVVDMLGMMGLGVVRGVVVQQCDVLCGVVEGCQQIDENLLLDIVGVLLYVDVLLDDQVVYLGVGGSGEDDLSVVENWCMVEVLVYEVIVNFVVVCEYFVVFIEISWNYVELQDVLCLLGDVFGVLCMFDLGIVVDYLCGVQQYIEVELIGCQCVFSGCQLDILVDVMVSLEYYLEVLCDCCLGCEDIFEIICSSFEVLCYWLLLEYNVVVLEVLVLLLVECELVVLQVELLQLECIEVLVQFVVFIVGDVLVLLLDFIFDLLLVLLVLMVFDNCLMFGVLGIVVVVVVSMVDIDVLLLLMYDDVEVLLVFVVFSVFVLDVLQWELVLFYLEVDVIVFVDDECSLIFVSFDLVSFELVDGDYFGVLQWLLFEVLQMFEEIVVLLISEMMDVVVLFGIVFDVVLVFDLVVVEQDVVVVVDDVVFCFDVDVLDNVDDVLLLYVMEMLLLDDDVCLQLLLEIVDVVVLLLVDVLFGVLVEVDQVLDELLVLLIMLLLIEVFILVVEIFVLVVLVIDIDIIVLIDFSEVDVQFFVELSVVVVGFNLQVMVVVVVLEVVDLVVVGIDVDINVGFDVGFDDDVENIDEDICEVFLEEFDDELVNFGMLLLVWWMQLDNMDWLCLICCIFYIFKGSGCLVGVCILGEFVWKIEGMFNCVLDGSCVVFFVVLVMVDNVYVVLFQLNVVLCYGQCISVDLQVMQVIVDCVGVGEEIYYVFLFGVIVLVVLVVEVEGEDEISCIFDVEMVVLVLVDIVEEVEVIGMLVNIDSVLCEIFEVEVEVYQVILQDWLCLVQQVLQLVSDVFLCVVYIMNGVFVMIEVFEIMVVIGGVEFYIKCVLVVEVVLGDEGVVVLDVIVQVIIVIMEVLQVEQLCIVLLQVLVQCLQVLVSELLEVCWLMVGLEDDEVELVLDDELVVEWDVDVFVVVVFEIDVVLFLFVVLEQELQVVVDVVEVLVEDVVIEGEGGLEVGELIVSDDFLCYFDVGWLLVLGEGVVLLLVVELIWVVDDVLGVEVDGVEVEVESVLLLFDDVGLIVVDDLLLYLDVSVLLVDDCDVEEIFDVVEIVVFDLNVFLFDYVYVVDVEVFEMFVVLLFDSELLSLQDEMVVLGFVELVLLDVVFEVGLYVIDEEQFLVDDG